MAVAKKTDRQHRNYAVYRFFAGLFFMSRQDHPVKEYGST